MIFALLIVALALAYLSWEGARFLERCDRLLVATVRRIRPVTTGTAMLDTPYENPWWVRLPATLFLYAWLPLQGLVWTCVRDRRSRRWLLWYGMRGTVLVRLAKRQWSEERGEEILRRAAAWAQS